MSIKNYKDLATPCFVFDNKKFAYNIKRFDNAFKAMNMKCMIAYSVKTNSLPFVIKTAYNAGCMLEVVSYDEYNLVRSLGVLQKRIVYNGIIKNKETFIDAVDNGAVVNIENLREIEWLKNCKRGSSVGIRVNVNLNHISPDSLICSDGVSRFGLSYENGDIGRAITKIESLGMKVNGLHLHKESDTRDVKTYVKMINYALNIISHYNIDINYIDIGGGFYGDIPNRPSFNDYVQAISNYINLFKDICIIVEPGSSVIASPIDFVTSVIDTKKIDNRIYCSVDGSRIDVDPLFHKTKYIYEIIYNQKDKRAVVNTQVISGCTCMEKDILFSLNDRSALTINDKIVIHRVGAYTMTLSPNFIRYQPNVYMKTDDDMILIRKKWTYHETKQQCE